MYKPTGPWTDPEEMTEDFWKAEQAVSYLYHKVKKFNNIHILIEKVRWQVCFITVLLFNVSNEQLKLAINDT